MIPDLAELVPLSQLILIRGLIPSKQRQKTKCPPTCSSVKTSAMAGDWQILRPLPPHLPLIPSNEFMPEIQGKKRAPTGLPSRFQVSLELTALLLECEKGGLKNFVDVICGAGLKGSLQIR